MNYKTGKFQKTNRDSRQIVQGQATVFCTPLGGKDVGNVIMRRDSLRHIPYFLQHKTYPSIWGGNGSASYSSNVALHLH